MGNPVNFYSRLDSLPINFYSRPDRDFLNAIFYLPMDGTDTSTSFIDQTGRHTVTANGNAQIDIDFSVYGTGSGLFDGSGDYLTTANSSDWDISGNIEFTIAFYFRLHSQPSAGSWFTIFNRASGGSFIHDFIYVNNTPLGGNFYFLWRIGSDFGTDGGYQSPDLSLLTDVWYYVVLIKTASRRLEMYLDGVLQTFRDGINTDYLNNFSSELRIGSSVGNSNYFDGWIDEFVWYSVAHIPGGQPVNFYSLP